MFRTLPQLPEHSPGATHSQNVKFFLMNQEAIMQEFKTIRSGLKSLDHANQKRNDKEQRLQQQQVFEEKIQGIQSSCAFINELGMQTKDNNLQTLAVAGSAVTQMYSSGLALLSSPAGLAALNPIAMLGIGALTLFKLFGKKKNQGDDNGMGVLLKKMQALSQQVYDMHQDMRDLFEVNFANQQKLLNTVIEGFDYLEKTILSNSQRFEAIAVERFERIEATIRRIGQVLANGQETIALQDFGDILSQAKALIEGRIVQNLEANCEENARKITDWIELGGRTSLPLHTGARWVPRSPDADYYSTIIEVFRELSSGSVTNMLGFLGDYAHYHLGIDFADTAENTKVLLAGIFNPNLWVAACEQFIELKQEHGNLIPDPQNISIQRIIQAANTQTRFIQALRTTPSLFEALFMQYQNGINELKAVIDTAIVNQNASLPIPLDISNHIDSLIAQFGKPISNKPISAQGMAGDRYFIDSYKDRSYSGPHTNTDVAGIDLNSATIVETLAPFYLLERLGLGSISLGYTVILPTLSCAYTISALIRLANAKSLSWHFSIQISIVINGVCGLVPILTLKRQAPVANVKEILMHVDASLQSLGAGHHLSIIPAGNKDQLHALAKVKLQEYILARRKAAIQQVNSQGIYASAFNQAIAKIDANLQLLKAFCLAAGFHIADLQAMWNLQRTGLSDGQQIALDLQNYVNHGTIETPIYPYLSPQFGAVKERIVNRTQIPDANYVFEDNVHLVKINALVGELQLLAHINSLSVDVEVKTAQRKDAEEKVATIHRSNYQAGLAAGDEIALCYIVRALRENNFTVAADTVSKDHPDILLKISGAIDPFLKEGLLLGLSCKTTEVSTQLLKQGQIQAGIWLLEHSTAKVRQLTNAEPSDLVTLLEPSRATPKTQQGIGMTFFNKPMPINASSLENKDPKEEAIYQVRLFAQNAIDSINKSLAYAKERREKMGACV